MKMIKNVAEYLAAGMLLMSGLLGLIVGVADFIGFDIAALIPKPALSLILIIVGLLAAGLGIERIGTFRRQEEMISQLQSDIVALKGILDAKEINILNSLNFTVSAIALDAVEEGMINSIIKHYPLTQKINSPLLKNAAKDLLRNAEQQFKDISQGKYIATETSSNSFAFNGLKEATQIYSLVFSDSRYWIKGFGNTFSSLLRVRQNGGTAVTRVWILNTSELELCRELIEEEDGAQITTRIGVLEELKSRPHQEEFMVATTSHGNYVVITKSDDFDGSVRVEQIWYNQDIASKYYRDFQSVFRDNRLVTLLDYKKKLNSK